METENVFSDDEILYLSMKAISSGNSLKIKVFKNGPFEVEVTSTLHSILSVRGEGRVFYANNSNGSFAKTKIFTNKKIVLDLFESFLQRGFLGGECLTDFV